jgi:eukaryotic-like serine/threonine-protein kinase
MPADLQAARAVFLHAVGRLPPERWDGYVREACGGDAELEQQVMHLLQVHREAGSFLDRPAAALAATAAFTCVSGEEVAADPLHERPGTRIGPYKLLQRIGEGGMGTVFLAEQTQPVRRQVALKVIKAGMDSRQVIARFEVERQALALMDHVNIARVLDAGATEARLPYFVMELVRGVPITRYCDDNRLTPRARLELFVPVCQAIQHAHQKGIIHRDVKPSNVMITLCDGKPVPKVIDFGVAKATGERLTERTLSTQYGALVGTLQYVSPEQAERSALGVDTRSDVYSLGVLLYELLTGTTPLTHQRLQEATYPEILRMIKEEEPPRPSTRLRDSGEALASIAAQRHLEPARLTKLVRGELDWIVMKTLEKDRTRRYETANGLARDIERYLADEPVEACPPSAWYRFRKFARRNKAMLASATAVATAVLALVVVGACSALWLQSKEADRREAVARRETELRQGVETDFQTVTTWRDQARWATARQVLARTRERLGETGPADLRQRLDQAEADLNLVARLDAIRQKRVTVVEGKVDNRSTEQDYAAAFRESGFGQEGDNEEALAARIRASAIKGQLVAALDDWASETKEKSRRAWLLAVARQADPDEWRDNFRDPAVWENRAALHRLAEEASAGEEAKLAELSPPLLAALGMVLRKEPAGAIPLLTAAQRRYPNDFWLNMNLGLALSGAKKEEDAVGYYRAALAIRPQSVVAHNNIGTILEAKGRLDEAIQEYRRALELEPKFATAHLNLGVALAEKGRKALPVLPASTVGLMGSPLGQGPLLAASALIPGRNGGTDEAITHYKRALELDPKDATAHSNYGNALMDKGLLDEAIHQYDTAIELDAEHAPAHYNRGLALKDKSRLDEAIQEWREAVKFDPEHAPAHFNLGLALKDKGQLDEAIRHYQKAIEIQPKFALAHYNLGIALTANSQLDEAIQQYRTAIALDPKFVWARHNLGNALHDKGLLDEAIEEYRRAIELEPQYALTHNSLGNALRDKKQLDEAIQEYRRAIELDRQFANAHFNLGNALLMKGERDEAIKEYGNAIAFNPMDAEAHSNRGALLQAKGRLDEAITDYRAAIKIDPKNATYHDNLGTALRDKKQLDEAIQEWLEAVRLDFKNVKAHVNLGIALAAKGQLDEAITHYKEATKLDPKNAEIHYDFGVVLANKGRLDEAVRELKEAIELAPKFALAHGALGHTLLRQGQFVEARAATRRWLDLLPERHPERNFATRQLEQCERLITLDEKLPPILEGKEKPADDAERLALAQLCQEYKKRYAAAARFYAEAFEEKPERAKDLRNGLRYNAACAAALAGCGQGEDADKLDDNERTRLRQQALNWLKADLALWANVADNENPKAREAVQQTLQQWQTDADLAGLRDKPANEKLPEAERATCQQLWADVDALLARVKPKAKEAPPDKP